MIFDRVEIDRFGHLADLHWELRPGLNLVFGLNEAGKTTVLQAIRALLYRFPERGGLDYVYSRSDLAVRAALHFSNGDLAEVTRTHGRTRSLAGSLGGNPFDEDGLRARVGASQELFANIFGFSLEEMQQGADALRKAGVQETLYGVGLGGGFDVAAILQGLDEESGELFKERGQNPAINSRCSRIADLRKQRNAAELRPADYADLVKGLGEAEGGATALQVEIRERVAAKAALGRAKEAIPLMARLATLVERRQGLTVPQAFTPADVDRVPPLLAELREHGARRDVIDRQVVADRKERDGIAVDQQVLDVEAAIDRLYRAVDRIEAHHRDLPERTREAEQKERDVLVRLEELRPGWDMVRLSEWLLNDATRRAFDALVEEHDELTQTSRAAATAAKATDEQLHQSRQALATLAEPEDVGDLSVRLEGWADHHARRQEWRRLEGELDRAEGEVKAARRRLDPPWAWTEGEEPAALPVPDALQVREAEAAAEQLKDHRRDLERTLQEAADERVQLTETLEQQQAVRHLPSSGDRDEARGRRDREWHTIRGAWLGGDAVAEPEQSADAYEDRVAEADTLADRMFGDAQSVADRERDTVRIRQLAETEERLTGQLEALAAEEAAWQEAWGELWARAGIEPDSPGVMRLWLERHDKLVAQRRERDRVSAERDTVARDAAGYEAGLRAALGAPAEWSIDTVRERGEARCREAEAIERERERLGKEIGGLETRSRRENEACEGAGEALARWRERWQSALERLGFASDMAVGQARSLPADLRGLQGELRDAHQTRQRVTEMQDDLEAYREQVDEVARSVDPALVEASLEDAIASLHRRRHEALGEQQKREKLDDRVEQAEQKLRNIDEALAPLEAERQALLKKAGVESEADLEAAAAEARQAAEVDAQIDDVNERLRGLAPAEPEREAFEGYVKENPEILAHRISVLDDEMADLNEQHVGQQQAVGSARNALSTHDGTSLAARMELELQSERASLAVDVRRYAVLKLAQRLLEEEMGRFEAAHQPELLQRTGELFGRLTGGRYPTVLRRLGTNELAAVDADDTMLSPEQMSTGTRQQLYLALRLAYIDHYARQSEPLPIVLDDVLVNFDDARALAALQTLDEFSKEHQILFLTCHEHLVEMARQVQPDLVPMEIS
jgi:uncharacterized protein YhaN